MYNAKEAERKYEEAISRVYDITKENSPLRVKAEFIGCKECGSRLAKKYISLRYTTCKCPVCGNSLFSNTARERIKKAEEKAAKLKKEWEKALAKEVSESQPSFEESLRDTRDRFDYILEENKGPDFVEIVGKTGGDTITYRVYKDGSVCER